jgi:DNA-binding response OmpR family regulator
VGKVLVVVDEPKICCLIGNYLHKTLGSMVEYAHSGTEGADALLRGRYDLALVDVMLPELSGLDLAEIAANENTPVLLMSGHPETNFALHQFGYPYLLKPFSLEELRVFAAQVMSEHLENIKRVRSSVARMEANRLALAVALAESDRLMDASRRMEQLGWWERKAHGHRHPNKYADIPNQGL